MILDDQPVVPRRKPYKPRNFICVVSDMVYWSIFNPKRIILTNALLREDIHLMITSGINNPLHCGFDDAKVRVRFIVNNFFVLFPSSLLRQMLKIATNRGHALQICRIPHPE